MQIKAVLFDLGWTLVNVMESPEPYRRVLETYQSKFQLMRSLRFIGLSRENMVIYFKV